ATRVSFPTNSQPVGLFVQGTIQSHYALLKVRVPRQNVESFVQGTPFRDVQLSSTRRYFTFQSGVVWWQPDRPRDFRSGQVGVHGGGAVSIVIDLDDPDHMMVYLDYGL